MTKEPPLHTSSTPLKPPAFLVCFFSVFSVETIFRAHGNSSNLLLVVLKKSCLSIGACQIFLPRKSTTKPGEPYVNLNVYKGNLCKPRGIYLRFYTGFISNLAVFLNGLGSGCQPLEGLGIHGLPAEV